MINAETDALAANDAFYAALSGKDIAAMDGLWARTAEVTCIHPGWNVLAGRDHVMASWEAILRNPEQPRIVGGGAHGLHANGPVHRAAGRALLLHRVGDQAVSAPVAAPERRAAPCSFDVQVGGSGPNAPAWPRAIPKTARPR